MATSSSFVEEKGNERFQNPAPEEAKEEETKMSTTATKKAKKKVVRRMPQQEVDFVMSYDVDESYDTPDMGPLGEKHPYLAAWARALDVEMAEVTQKNHREMVERQKDYRQQLRTKGYVTYVVEVDDNDDDEEEESPAAVVAPRGRRRFRRGVLKRGVRITKLN